MQQILMDECNPSLDILDGESIPHGVQTSPVAMEEDVPLMVGSHDSGCGTSVTSNQLLPIIEVFSDIHYAFGLAPAIDTKDMKREQRKDIGKPLDVPYNSSSLLIIDASNLFEPRKGPDQRANDPPRTGTRRYTGSALEALWVKKGSPDTHKERSKNKKFIEAAVARLRRSRANPRRIHVPKDAWPGGISALPRKANGSRSAHPRPIVISIADAVVIAVIVVWQRKAGGEGCDRDGGGRGV
uniref:Uncharacterized protein n=1 Tax=Oryza sativa subsp. japonica TaxID=39947 RepID=Q10KY8_ORYSJ|nr:hypothetical protein LOC_Os03g25020 [Oryza sativa Japonica Group]